MSPLLQLACELVYIAGRTSSLAVCYYCNFLLFGFYTYAQCVSMSTGACCPSSPLLPPPPRAPSVSLLHVSMPTNWPSWLDRASTRSPVRSWRIASTSCSDTDISLYVYLHLFAYLLICQRQAMIRSLVMCCGQSVIVM